ncbi:MAG: hypothetical protein HYU64_12360 [Armatimonadetes bacterium]|nr:hypothetical protein [Armatimonadota bacterium]
MRKSGLFMPVLAVLVLAVVAGMALPVTTEDKRISNPTGFSIEVPTGWTVVTNAKPGTKGPPVMEINGPEASGAEFKVFATQWKGKTLAQSAESFRKEVAGDPECYGSVKILTDESVSIGRLKGHRFVWTYTLEEKNLKAHTTLLVQSEIEFSLTTSVSAKDYDKMAPVLEKLAQSFRLDK